MGKFMTRTAKRKSTVILSGLIALGAMAVALPPNARADGEVPFKGTFMVAAAATLNTSGITFCGGAPLFLVGEGHGVGYSTLGAFSVLLQKTLNPGPNGAMHGCFVLTAPDGDTLNATYDGIEGAPNANGFSAAAGTLTFTGGTGRFEDAAGSATFTTVFQGIYPASSFVGGTTAPLAVMAPYTVDGTVSLPDENLSQQP